MKLGSLFDGIGGFPYVAQMCGITPVWASEVEPFPIAVTNHHFPDMKHLGDITKINGAEIEPVDIITFGSPCQDLSIAGQRKGMKHENHGDDETTRSGLFMEAIRIIKEMREKQMEYIQLSLFGKTYPEHSVQTKEKILEPSLKNSAKLKMVTPLFLNLQKTSGQELGQFWEMGIPSLGERSTLNTGEFPNEENVSTLSQILEENVPEKYFLSPKACLGILNRAKRRGKELPDQLREALERQADLTPTTKKFI